MVVKTGLYIYISPPPTHPNIDSVVVSILGEYNNADLPGIVEKFTFIFLRVNIEAGYKQESMEMGRSDWINS